MKKAQTGLDTIIIPFIILGVVIALAAIGLVAIKVLPEIVTLTNQTNEDIGQKVLWIPSIINVIGWGFLLGMGISFIVTAWVLKAHPIFYGIGAISLILGVYMAMVVSNAFEYLGETPLVNETNTTLTFVTFVSNNIVGIITTVGLVALTLAYITFKKQGGGAVEELTS